jgi:thioredoxin reductase (NADPH)
VKPTLLAVDEDRHALARIERALVRRYGHDYRVVCEPSAGTALAELERLCAAEEPVAIVLANQWMDELKGGALLARAGELHPHARRGLLIDWGAWGHRPTAEAIFGCMARREMDYYVMKPVREPDEQFHRTIAEFLQEWSRTTSPTANQVVVVGDRWSAHAHRMRDLLARNGIPHRFHPNRSDEGRALLVRHELERAEQPLRSSGTAGCLRPRRGPRSRRRSGSPPGSARAKTPLASST